MHSLDSNGDGVLSAKEFKQWLFPTSTSHRKGTDPVTPQRAGSSRSDDDSIHSQEKQSSSVNRDVTSSAGTANAHQDHNVDYNDMASRLRQTLMRLGGDGGDHNAKIIVRKIFKSLDNDGDGNLSSEELRQFVESPELGLFDEHMWGEGMHVDISRKDQYVDMLVEQIDINRDGSVSLAELEDFIFPATAAEGKGDSARPEVGLMIQLTRKASEVE